MSKRFCIFFYKLLTNCLAKLHQTVISSVCLEGQWYETVFAPVGLVVSGVEGWPFYLPWRAGLEK